MIKDKDEKHLKVDRKGDHLISIMASPMLTGPATISFITVKANEIGLTEILINMTLAFILVGTIFYLFSITISKVNPTVISIVSRVMGLFLTAVSIEMIAAGILGLISIV